MERQVVVMNGRFCIGDRCYDKDEILVIPEYLFFKSDVQILLHNKSLMELGELKINKPLENKPLENKPDLKEKELLDYTHIYSKEELWKLNKEDQIKLLMGNGARHIPRLESDRVDLLLKLQNKKVNING